MDSGVNRESDFLEGVLLPCGQSLGKYKHNNGLQIQQRFCPFAIYSIRYEVPFCVCRQTEIALIFARFTALSEPTDAR
jgi:hypothetical protein